MYIYVLFNGAVKFTVASPGGRRSNTEVKEAKQESMITRENTPGPRKLMQGCAVKELTRS